MFMAFRVENLDRKLVLQLQTKLLGQGRIKTGVVLDCKKYLN